MPDQVAPSDARTSFGDQRPTAAESHRPSPTRLWLALLSTTLVLLILASGTASAQRGLLRTEGPYYPPPERLHVEHYSGTLIVEDTGGNGTAFIVTLQVS